MSACSSGPAVPEGYYNPASTAALAKSLGGDQYCVTAGVTNNTSGDAPFVSVKNEFSASASAGCGALQLISNQMAAATKVFNCALTEMNSETIVDTRAFNKIVFTGTDIVFDNSCLELSQTIDVKINVNQGVNFSGLSAIQTKLDTALAVQSEQDRKLVKTGNTTSENAKTVADIVQKSLSESAVKEMTRVISEIYGKVDNGNTLTINADELLSFRDIPCGTKWDQSLFIDMQIAQAVGSVVKRTIETEVSTEMKAVLKQASKEEVSAWSSPSVWGGVVGGIVGLILLGVLGWYLWKRFGKKKLKLDGF